jgi:hypothetical protein
MKIGVRNRKSVGPVDVAFAGIVAAYCICGNALATAYVEPLSADNLGPLALAYHDRRPALYMLPLLLLLLLACPVLPLVGRGALIAFVGAAWANIASAAFWQTGVPDYIVFRNVDVIANVSDLVMIGSAAVVVGTILAQLARRK